jgi:hypothetical protein
VVAILLLLVFLVRCGGEHLPALFPQHADTVVKERTVILPPDTVYIDKIKSRVVRVPYAVLTESGDTLRVVDTVLSTSPFRATIDTIIGCTQVKIAYRFPEHQFENISFRTCPDTIKLTDTTIVTKNDSSFWDDVSNVAIGFAAGVLVMGAFFLGTNK